MRVDIHESYPGEIDGTTPDALATRLDAAFHEGARLVMLEKGGVEHGDVDALDELRQLMTAAYTERAEQLKADILKAAAEHG